MTSSLQQRRLLPQLSDRVFLTDGGIETTLIYHQGLDLPEFAGDAQVLIDDDAPVDQLLTPYSTA